MKAAASIFLSWLLMIGSVFSEDDFENWTNRQGQTMSARFISVEDGIVTFEKADGKRFEYLARELDLDGQDRIKKLSQIPAQFLHLPLSIRARCNQLERERAIEAEGGSPETEEAIIRGLTWLAGQQDPDGAMGEKYLVGMTGLSLLAFLGHCEATFSEEWSDPVVKAAMYLMTRAVKNDGLITTPDSRSTYEHAIATYALAELHLLSKDSGRPVPRLESIVKRAVEIILEGQTNRGGWCYRYAQNPVGDDLSVSGWQLQALHATRSAGILEDKIEPALDKAVGYLKKAQDDQGAFKYRIDNPQGKATLTASALHHLHLWGEQESPEFQSGMTYLLDVYSNPTPGVNLYTHYYNTMVFFAEGGETWTNYQEKFMPALLEAQNPDGSFLEDRVGHAKEDSQIMNTALGVTILEVYYRYARRPNELTGK